MVAVVDVTVTPPVPSALAIPVVPLEALVRSGLLYDSLSFYEVHSSSLMPDTIRGRYLSLAILHDIELSFVSSVRLRLLLSSILESKGDRVSSADKREYRTKLRLFTNRNDLSNRGNIARTL